MKLTPEQYKGIGKYLKPWGKPPTKFTFWCQIITTVVVIIISIGKAVESLRDPTFLAFAIVGVMFGLVLLAGYLKAVRDQKRQIAEEEARQKAEDEADAAAPSRKPQDDDDDDDDDEPPEAARARAQAEAQARQRAMAEHQASQRVCGKLLLGAAGTAAPLGPARTSQRPRALLRVRRVSSAYARRGLGSSPPGRPDDEDFPPALPQARQRAMAERQAQMEAEARNKAAREAEVAKEVQAVRALLHQRVSPTGARGRVPTTRPRRPGAWLRGRRRPNRRHLFRSATPPLRRPGHAHPRPQLRRLSDRRARPAAPHLCAPAGCRSVWECRSWLSGVLLNAGADRGPLRPP